MLGLDIGAGEFPTPIEDCRMVKYDIRPNTFPDVVGDAVQLPFRSRSFDRVHSSHVLEHFPRQQWQFVLHEWLRVVADRGQIWLQLPNIEWAANQIVHNRLIDVNVMNVLYGGQENPYDFHYTGFTPQLIGDALREFGFELRQLTLQGFNMFLRAERKAI